MQVKLRSPALVILGMLGVLASGLRTQAQERPATIPEGETAPGAGSKETSRSETDAGTETEDQAEATPEEGASDAKRIVRIRRTIQLDKAHLRWLRSDLRSRTRWFEDLAAGMGGVAEERNEKKEALEALEKDPHAAPEDVAALRSKFEELQEDWSLYDTQTDLALKAEKTVREQINALEKKIGLEEHALGVLSGDITGAPPEAPESGEGLGTVEAKETTRLRTPVPLPTSKAPPEPAREETHSAMTTSQLEAQRALERKEQEVGVAKAALAEFVERKRSLQRQIEFEERLEKSDAEEIENLEHAHEVLVARLDKYRETHAPSELIQRRERGQSKVMHIVDGLEKTSEERAKYIESLHERLAQLDESELRVTAEVEAKRDEVRKARRRIMWLQSPIHPRNIAYWAKERGPRILMVIGAALFLLLFVQLSARRIARTLVRTRRGARSKGTGRADTLAFSVRSAARVLIVVFALLLVLQESGVDIKTVLGGAAILGVAIAFGAQDLMKDYFSGFLILAEDQYQLGDLVTVRGITGTVESVNMRVTVLRDLEGRVHFIPNGNIDQVTNRTYAWGRPVLEIPVDFDEDVDRVMTVLVDLAKGLRDDPDWKGSIIGDPEMLGVDKFTEFGVVIKFMMKTQPNMLFAVRREMLRRISKRFKELGIRITVPQRIVLRGGPGGES